MPFKVKKKSAGYDSNSAALNLISYRARSEREIRDKLAERNFDAEEIEKTVKWLKGYGYLNDEQFAKDLSSSRVRVKSWGPLKIRQELSHKGLSSDHIQDALGDYDESLQLETSTEAMEKWLRKKGYSPPLDEKERNKAILYLKSRGFTGDIIIKTVKKFSE